MGLLIAIIPLVDGAVVQLGERLICIQEVRGSNPLGSTNGAREFFSNPMVIAKSAVGLI